MNPSHDQRTAVSLQHAALQQALRDLDPPHQRVVALRFIGRRSVLQIARILQCSESQVKVLQAEALRALQGKLASPHPPAARRHDAPSAPPR